MKVRFINLSKYKMSKMPIKHYLPKVNRYWSGQIWQFTILRDYGIELDFRKGNIIDQLLNPPKKKV